MTSHPDAPGATPTRARRGAALARFLIPSLLGLAMFVVPVPDGDGAVSIPVALFAGWLGEALAPVLPWLGLAIIAVSALGSLAVAVLRPSLDERPLAAALFRVGPLWTALRLLGLLVAIMVVCQIGPEQVWGENTGAVLLDLVTLMVTVFLVAGLLMPLLLEFGLLEFTGTLMTKVMRPLFTVPGRSSVSSLAAWLGDGSIGVLMTGQQYQKGYFTRREAAVLGTTFNVVSVTFTIVIVGMLDLMHMFGPFYVTTVVAGLVAALIIPRIPPLSRFSDERASGATHTSDAEERHQPGPLLPRAWHAALDKAASVTPREAARMSGANVLEMWLGTLPIIMALGTAAVMVAEFTDLFTWLGAPFVGLLGAMGIPDAGIASEALFIGFADMLLPAVIVEGAAEMTRFVIGALSITQLIYMSEVGGLLLASSIPVKFHHLVAIFLLRTAITLPVIVGLAHLFY